MHLSVSLCVLHFFVVFVKPHFVRFCGYLHRFVVRVRVRSLWQFVSLCSRFVQMCCHFASIVVLRDSAVVRPCGSVTFNLYVNKLLTVYQLYNSELL